MRISTYTYLQEDYLTDSVAEAMALFSVRPGAQKGSGAPSGDSIVVRNTVNENLKSVRTEVFYRHTPDEVGCLDNTQSAAGDEEFSAAAKRLVRLNLLFIMRRLTGVNPGPWGILRGVRPTKIPHKMLDAGVEINAVIARMTERYAVADEKARLVAEIAVRQRGFLPRGRSAYKLVSVYIGIPYCPSRCLYCSFPAQVLPRERSKMEEFLSALAQDIRAAKQQIDRYGLKVETIYIGGGTPTSLTLDDFTRLLDLVNACFRGPELREFTVEAGRPDSLDEAKIIAMRTAGVTRSSVNPQTMQEKSLKLIGRSHTVQDIIVMLDKMRYLGIPVINADLIVGLPDEGVREISDTMEQISRLAPDNLTIHTLALKKGSLLKENTPDFMMAQEDAAVRMLAIADDCARQMGMVPYYLYRQKYMLGNLENVGYTKPGCECVYNISIIEERQTIIGIGPAAATKAVWPDRHLKSCYNPKDVATYINKLATYLDRREKLLSGLFETEEE